MACRLAAFVRLAPDGLAFCQRGLGLYLVDSQNEFKSDHTASDYSRSNPNYSDKEGDI